MEFQQIVNLLDTTSDDKDYQDLLLKNGLKLMITQKKINVNKEIRIKTPMLRSDLSDFSAAYNVVKGTITVTEPDNAKRNKCLHLRASDPLSSYSESFKYKMSITGNTYNLVAGNANYDANKVGKNET